MKDDDYTDDTDGDNATNDDDTVDDFSDDLWRKGPIQLARIINLSGKVCKPASPTGGYYFHVSSFKQHPES